MPTSKPALARRASTISAEEREAKRSEDRVAGDDDVLRIEVILKSEKLVEEFRNLGSRTVRIRNIDGKPLLLSFAWADLFRVHQSLIGRFSGAFYDLPPTADKTDGIGRFIAVTFCSSAVLITWS